MTASPFDRYSHFEELNDPLDTQAGVLTPSQRKALARANLGVTSEASAGGTDAAAGSDAAGATVLTHQVSIVTGADGAKGVALPAAAAGLIYDVTNAGSAPLLVYPVSGGNDNINSLAEDAAYTLDAGKSARFVSDTATHWYTRSETKSVTYQVPVAGAAKLGGSGAGWAIDGDNALPLATLAAGSTSEVLLMAIPGLQVGDILTGVGVVGQIESAGNTASGTLDVRKTTAAAADVTDASLGTDTISVTADTIMSVANFGVTGLSDTVAADEMFYVTITMTTAASTDVALQGLSVTVTRRTD